MIKISCSKLEDVRQYPQVFAQQLATGNESGGGRYGMFQCWQSKVREVHKGKYTAPEAIKSLQQRFMSYADNVKNKRKQEFFIDRLTPYIEEFNNRNYNYLGAQKQIEWKLIPEVSLTGHTPNLVKNDNGFAAYFYMETPILWQSQLRFPLIQYYLAEKIFKCPLSEVEIGTYTLSTLSFDLKQFTEGEMNEAILETKDLFKKVFDGYKK